MEIVALRTPAAAGKNRIVNVEFAPGASGDVGWAVTVKSPAFGPATATFGVPLRLTGSVPTFATVNVRSTPLPPTTVWPKSALPVTANLPTGVEVPPRVSVP